MSDRKPKKKAQKEIVKESFFKKYLLFIDILMILVFFVIWKLLWPNYISFLVAFVLIIAYIFSTKRNPLIFALIIAGIISVIWMLFNKEQYGYNQEFGSIFGISIYPLFWWAFGLFLTYLIYTNCEKELKNKSFFVKLIVFALIYWPLLILTETMMYHIFNVHNDTNAGYEGLPFCDCIHAPRWMQAVYFLLGPLFFSVVYLFNKYKKTKIRED